MLSLASPKQVVPREVVKSMLSRGSGDSCYESRHLPGRLKVAPYEVRGRVAKIETVPKGRLNSALATLVGEEIFCL